ncbi:unnamed protein product (macronuclear) [Paramecium tetraurelia]|uniref:B box-type domain-containing protein n=1 Tax=Paramecium tetraurelia TaxID=5888 RepID=A0E1V1_PARTE|nr:uncharacterized protein GSPATT00022439001 [Paramecium tetraurelia]CAK89268.1 unnamed protein product [Paramecium tetraurelia]|eukprot:XP_001456665.1 hypothetical protein (macronuclear) [Paramecium tetraurelia strain d4-2]
MYVCQELQCIELQNNKLLCQKCLCQHRGVNYIKLKERAFNNYNQYKSNLEQDIADNSDLKKKIEQDITEIQSKIFKIFSDLQKNLIEFVDQQSRKISRNKTNAEKLMQDSNPSLDTYIYFAKFSVDKKVHEQAKQQITQTIDDLISDLKQKIDYLKPSTINENIIKIEEQSFKIESFFQKKSPFGYCNEHCKQKSSICTNITCLELNDLEYHCERCSKTSHAEHFQKDFLQEYDKLKKEQKAKLDLISNEKQEIKLKAQKVINDLINDLKKLQKESYFKYEEVIKIIKVFFQDFEKDLSQQDTKYVFGDLLFQIISTKEEEFQLKLNQQYQNFEEKLKSCRKDNAVQFSEECQKLQEKQDEIFKLKKTIKELELAINEKDQLIKKQSPENQLKVIQNNTEQILKAVSQQFKSVSGVNNISLQSKPKLQQQNVELNQPIQEQVLNQQNQQNQYNSYNQQQLSLSNVRYYEHQMQPNLSQQQYFRQNK